MAMFMALFKIQDENRICIRSTDMYFQYLNLKFQNLNNVICPM